MQGYSLHVDVNLVECKVKALEGKNEEEVEGSYMEFSGLGSERKQNDVWRVASKE